MGQQEFDAFLLHLKQWKDVHIEEYDLFEEEINQKSDKIYGKILFLATLFCSKYIKFIRRSLNQGAFQEDSEIEEVFLNTKLPHYLVNSVNCPTDTFTPLFLSWLYFGKAFERMVEKGLEFKKNCRLSYVHKFFIDSIIKYAVSKSISSGLRTESDWEEHFKLVRSVDENRILYAINNTTTNNIEVNNTTINNNYHLLTNKEESSETNKNNLSKVDPVKNKVGRPNTKKTTLIALFEKKVSQPESLLKYIESYLKQNKTGLGLTYLRIALEELEYTHKLEHSKFYHALESEFKELIAVKYEAIVAPYNSLIKTQTKNEEQGKNLSQNRKEIDEIKTELSRFNSINSIN